MFECRDEVKQYGGGDQFIPILSIIIPTRNRRRYAISAIRSILNISAPDLELVVQDSSDSNELEGWIASNVQDTRLRFNYSKPPISMTENFNQAVQMATGEYICVIGDDDGVNPEIVSATHWAKAKGLDALAPNHGGASYCWPDFRSRYFGMAHAGKLFVNNFSGRGSYPDVEKEMKKCVLNAAQSKYDLPKVYLGIVRRQCMLEVYKRTGVYFGGVSPDVFGALAVANYAKSICVIDYPLILPGSAGESNSGRSAMGKHKGRLEDDPHMQFFQNLEWPEIVPKFFSVQTVWAEAAVEALRATGRADLLRQFNVPLLHAQCAVLHPDYFIATVRNLYRAMRAIDCGYVRGTFRFVIAVFTVLNQQMSRIIFRLLHPKRGVRETEFSDLSNIEEAVRALSEHLRRSGRRFDEHLQ